MTEFEKILDPDQIASFNSFAIQEDGKGGLTYEKGAWPYLHVNLIYNGCEIIKGVIVNSNTNIPLDLSRKEDSDIYNSIVRDTKKQCMSHPGLIVGS